MMKKKKNVNPLDLDKETIAKLDEKQLEALAGGAGDPDEEDEGATFTASVFRCKEELAAEGDCCKTIIIKDAQ